MRKPLIFFLFILFTPFLFAQKKNKTASISFCGFSYSDTAKMRQHFGKQLAFLKIMDNDTIVDIGAQSGSYEGILSVIGNFKRVSFFLVDIDSNCLGKEKVNNMIEHYQDRAGAVFKNNFIAVNNTVDSLWLPLNRFKKAWILNTLHEIPGKQKMIQDIYNILAPGGEIVIMELLATEKYSTHGGCHMPLMTKNEIDTIATLIGFVFKEELINPVEVKKMKNPILMTRYIKN